MILHLENIQSNNSVYIQSAPATIIFSNPENTNIGETINVTISGHNTNFMGYSGTGQASWIFYDPINQNFLYPSSSTVYANNVIIGSLSVPNSSSYYGNYTLQVY